MLLAHWAACWPAQMVRWLNPTWTTSIIYKIILFSYGDQQYHIFFFLLLGFHHKTLTFVKLYFKVPISIIETSLYLLPLSKKVIHF